MVMLVHQRVEISGKHTETLARKHLIVPKDVMVALANRLKA